MSRKQFVILGGGTGGTMVANRLRRRFDADQADIHVVDRDDRHVYQPGLLFVPFGLADLDEIVRPRRRQLRSGVTFHEADVESVDVDADSVRLADGSHLRYDVLVVASGARLQPEETEGMTGPGWGERVFTFYSPDGAQGLHDALQRFTGGRLVVNVVDMPIKCPVAPLEFAFLADWYLREKGVRGRTELVYATPLDGAFTKPIASQELAGLLAQKEIELVTEFNAGEVDGAGGALAAYDGTQIPLTCWSASLCMAARPTLSAHRAWAMHSGSCPPTVARCRPTLDRTCSRWATRPTCRPPRQGLSRTSRPRCWSKTSPTIWPGRSSRTATTGMPTASSRPDSRRRF